MMNARSPELSQSNENASFKLVPGEDFHKLESDDKNPDAGTSVSLTKSGFFRLLDEFYAEGTLFNLPSKAISPANWSRQLDASLENDDLIQGGIESVLKRLTNSSVVLNNLPDTENPDFIEAVKAKTLQYLRTAISKNALFNYRARKIRSKGIVEVHENAAVGYEEPFMNLGSRDRESVYHTQSIRPETPTVLDKLVELKKRPDFDEITNLAKTHLNIDVSPDVVANESVVFILSTIAFMKDMELTDTLMEAYLISNFGNASEYYGKDLQARQRLYTNNSRALAKMRLIPDKLYDDVLVYFEDS